jgi:hypothetical protein
MVLVELKVSEDFRVTDLQALAYAGAYAKRTPQDLARTLQRHLQRQLDSHPPAGSGSASSTVGLDDAFAKIGAFIEIDDVDDWQPSQHVRIKLVAPNFPRRVLQTVKWLGDVYSVRIEAVTVRLFETSPGQFSVAFERLLPLPADEHFDMTIRERENRQRVENTSRRPAVLPLLVNNGKLVNGQELWVTQNVLRVEHRHLWDPESLVFRARVHAEDGVSPKLAWRASEDDPEEILSPSTIPYRVYCSVIPEWTKEFTSPVASAFAISEGGKTLEDLAFESGLWETALESS